MKGGMTAFLQSPHCSLYRHLSLQLIVLMITLNVFWYEPLGGISWIHRFWGWFFYYGAMNVAIYTNLYVLIPRYLLTNRLKSYVLSVIGLNLIVLLLVTVTQGLLFGMAPSDRNPDEFTLIINGFSGGLTMGFVIAGSTALSLFRYWLSHSLRIGELEASTLETELKYLKNQINPHFLFNMLNNANVLIKRNPVEASEVLFKLEDLLRYQINESSHERVLLVSDIHFLNDYLNLEKIRRDHFQFKMVQKGNLESIRIQPLLFIPFVENAVKHSFDSEHPSSVLVSFGVEENRLNFRCENTKPAVSLERKVGGIGLTNIQRRLELLYPGSYELQQRETENQYIVNLTITI